MSFRRRMMIAAKSKPYDAEIEYLEGTGSQYINTDFINTANTEFTIDFQLTNSTGDMKIIGQAQFFGFAILDNKWRISDKQWYLTTVTTDTNRHTVSTDDGKYYLDTTLLADRSNQKGIGIYPMYIFATSRMNRLEPSIGLAKMKLYSCIITDNGVAIRDYIPVRIGQVGYMYDRVSGQLFGNSGSDNFILGPDKTFNPSNPVPNDEIWYTTTDNFQLSIGTPSGYGANFVSNTYANGKGVIKFDGDINNIPEDAFSFLKKLQTIALPDSVTAIHGKAFSNCSGLTTIQLGKGLLTMNDNYQGAGGSFTFDDCYNLSKIVSLKSVAATVDNWCFHDFRQVGSTVPCVLAIPSGATGYNNWKYTIDDDNDVTADTTFYSFTTKTLEESDCLFLNT